MKTENKYYVSLISCIFLLSGCVVRTYSVTKDRVDQDLAMGNRGYLKGQAPAETKERKATRTTQVVEVELYSPVKFEKMPKPQQAPAERAPLEKTEDKTAWGNRGYITEGPAPSMPKINIEKYTVQKGDTLQKISKKFYGTPKRWNRIYEANKDNLRAPDKIYPGQVLDIPVEALKETKENLK